MQILQVEDDSEAAKAIEFMLQSDGHSCETTTYGEDAFKVEVISTDLEAYSLERDLRIKET